MNKKHLIFGLLVMFAWILIPGEEHLSAQNGFANYITISNGRFWDGDSPFYPICINYLVEYPCDMSDKDNPINYISPNHMYSKIMRKHDETWLYNRTIDSTERYGYGDNGSIARDSARIKLELDLHRIDSLGFNVVRINPAIHWSYGVIKIPTGSYAEYFRTTDSLIAKCAANNLRVILVLSDKTETYNQFDQFCVYLDSVTRHYSTNKTVMAYVVYMEPGYKWGDAQINDKLLISNWSRKWYYLIKKNAPNQLVTYGLGDPAEIMVWDPAALTYDFLSMHFYYNHSNPDTATSRIQAYFKWMHDNIDDVWVIGETGLAGTLEGDTCLPHPEMGTEADQSRYVDSTMRKSLEYGCKGYAWWQYHEVMWNSCTSKHYGLSTFYPEQRLKPAASRFYAFPSGLYYIDCSRPNCYYDFYYYGHNNFSGVVKDQNGNPIKDAVVKAWSPNYYNNYSTFTNEQGEYTIHTPDDTVVSLVWISHKGYTSKSFFHNSNTFENHNLTHINYNHWQKNWTNHNYRIPGDTFVLVSITPTLVGNFCGDEAQEMFVMNASSNTASLYRFNINHWEQLWEGPLGDWTINASDKFFAGDFNGNGYDDILCVRDSSNSLACIYSYNPQIPKAPWLFVWTNLRNGKIGSWIYSPGDILLPGHFNDTARCSLMCIRNQGRMKKASCQQWDFRGWMDVWSASSLLNGVYIGSWCLTNTDKYYVGDFSGDGFDELFCVQTSQGTTDKMTLMQYGHTWATLWTNNGVSEGIGIYPYRANLHVGNFDSDSADELLGVESWATKFDLNASNQWDWSWSSYESGKLSDWAVNPNHRIFFMKTMTDVPDYLFVARGNPRIDYQFDGYSFNP